MLTRPEYMNGDCKYKKKKKTKKKQTKKHSNRIERQSNCNQSPHTPKHRINTNTRRKKINVETINRMKSEKKTTLPSQESRLENSHG